MLSKLNLKRALVALVAIVAMLAAATGVSHAGMGSAPPIKEPAGINPDEVISHWEYQHLAPWEHTIVVAHVTSGANESAGLVDIYQIVASFADYANGKIPFAVDAVITIDPDSVGIDYPIEGYGNDSERDDRQDSHGDIALALYQARIACGDAGGDGAWVPEPIPCDVILVTYELPSDSGHRRHAMAEAIRLAADGHQLHTIAIDQGANSADSGEWVSEIDPAHAQFSQLLGANGSTSVSSVLSAPTIIWEMVIRRYYQPVYYEPDFDDCWDCEEPWYGEDDCEVYDPDGYCYYGDDERDEGNLVDIGFAANHLDETNWISLVTAEDNAEIIELRYAVSDQYIDCDDASPTPEVAPELGILVDSNDIGQHYCLRVEFEDGNVQFLDHQLQAWDLVWFDDEGCPDDSLDCVGDEVDFDEEASVPDTDIDYELFWEITEYMVTRICVYPGLAELQAELDEYVQWLIEDSRDYLESNYPEVGAGIIDELLETDLASVSEEMTAFCQEIGGAAPETDAG